MCLPEAIVIVIVRPRNDEGARFKYINVRKESRMVAQLPQQVFLLLVLITGTTTGTVYRSQLSDWTSTSSTRRVGASATRLPHPASFKGHETSGRTSGHGRRALDTTEGFSKSWVDLGVTIMVDRRPSRNFRSGPVFSISDAKISTYKRKKSKSKNQNVHENEEFKEDGEWVHFKGLEQSSVSDDKENQLKPKSRYQRFITKEDKREMRLFPSPSIDGSDSFSSDSRISSDSNDELTSVNSQSQYGDERSSVDSKVNRFTPNANSIGIDDTQNSRSSQRLYNFESRIVEVKASKIDDATSIQRTDGNPPTSVQPVLSNSLEPVNQSTLVVVETPLIVQDTVNSSTERNHQALNDPTNDLQAHTVIDSSNVHAKSRKFWKEVESTALTPKASSLNLIEKEQSIRIDLSPSHFLYTRSVDVSFEDKQRLPTNSDQYTKRKMDLVTSISKPLPLTTWPTTAVGFPKRYVRDAESDKCEKFLLTDDTKREFYSPNYPQLYPPSLDCYRTLEAEKGMLLKLDFRDRFELESTAPTNNNARECRFDYLEVRDGQYGFSNLLGVFCDNHFPPEIISKSRHLWLHFHSDDTIEYGGFKAVWSTVPRPTSSGVPPELEPCVRKVTNQSEVIVGIEDVKEEKKIAEQYKVALDCLWIITVPSDSRMQLTFDPFKLEKPNDCSANFLDVFDGHTDIPSRLKNFCGSIAETINSQKNVVYIRFYLEPKAINGKFKSLITTVRDKGSTDKPCRDDEYDCEDNTCIALSLRCNNRFNCRFLRDEDVSMCGTTPDQFDSSRVIIILVIFSLIMFGMCFTFVFNCIRKLVRDHRIIREHIRQSRENRLDEIGRKTTPCPVSLSRTDLHDRGSESPSVEIDSSKELIPATLVAHEYTKELVLEMKYGTKEMNDIHQSNNVSNATQERMQESSEGLEMCDSSCQTRESLFEPRNSDAAHLTSAFSTFGYRKCSEANNGISLNRRVAPQKEEHYHQNHHHHLHQHHHPHPPLRQCSQQSQQSQCSNSPPSRHPVSEQCSVCMSLNSREGSVVICPKHNPIPAPPGWSLHDPPYPHLRPTEPSCSEDAGCTTYKRYQSPKPDRNPMTIRNHHQHRSPLYTRQPNVGSGERYDSLIYGSGRASSNTASNTTTSNTTGSGSQNSATPKYPQTDSSYRAEAVIEVDQKRPFSIESTKSAPDVIATH